MQPADVLGGAAASHIPVIRAALSKTIEQPTIFKDLEDALIHFTHAGYVKKGEEVDPTLRAKATADYLKTLATESVDVMGCYRDLCDITHPGISSVRCYADGFETAIGTGYSLRFDRDAKQIEEFCKPHEAVSRRMIFFSVVPPVMTLRLLNDFGVREIHTPSVMSVVHDGNPAWQPFAARLRDDSPPNVKSIELPEEAAPPFSIRISINLSWVASLADMGRRGTFLHRQRPTIIRRASTGRFRRRFNRSTESSRVLRSKIRNATFPRTRQALPAHL